MVFISVAQAPTRVIPGVENNSEAKSLVSYPMFDWLRISLASLVALLHQGLPDIGPIDGNLAVTVFLALSGWLIGGVLLRTTVPELPRFFFNRATRIWIPYAFSVALIFGLAALRDGIDTNWLKYLFYDVTFTHYNFTEFPRAQSELPMGGTGNHFWSISVEEQFYLLAPLVMFALPFGKDLRFWLVATVLLLAMHSIFSAIALGVVAAMLAQTHPGVFQTPAVRMMIWSAVVLTFCLCIVLNIPPLRALFAIFLVIALAVPGPRSELGIFLGAISYPLYLNHWMGSFLVNGVAKQLPTMPAPMIVLASYTVSIFVGVATWAMIDRWVMRDRNAWFTPNRGIVLGAVAYGLLLVGISGGLYIRANGG